MRTPLIVLLATAVATPSAAAQPEVAPPEVAPPEVAPPEETQPAPPPVDKPRYQSVDPASSFNGAPRPNEARNLARDDRSAARHLLWVPRVIMFPVKWTLWAAMSPVRGGLYLFDRYQLGGRFKILFFNDKQTFGIYPVAFFETGFGLNIGARVVHKDLFGDNERVTLRASYGGAFKQLYSGKLRTGERLSDKAELTLAASFEIQATAGFWGLGNRDLVANDDVMGIIDPRDAATRTAFRQDIVRVALGVEYELAPNLTVGLSSAYRHRTFDDPEAAAGEDLDQIYDTAALAGYQDGVDNVYAELNLAYDSRRNTHRFVWGKATGWRLNSFVGYAVGFEDDDSTYVRYGLDVQRLIDLYRGNRVLVVRAYTEAITSDLADTPFTDLPKLGGPLLLRGYSSDRFRDRVLTLGTAEYQYSLSRNFWAFAFADYGRVFRSYKDFEFEDFRLGYGVGIQSHSQDKFQFRAHIASSIDGGVFLAFSFDPVFELDSRTGRNR